MIFWYANCARLRGEVRHPSDGHHDYDAIRAGLAEGVVADIVGHEKPTMTYGLYSGRATLETKRKAIAKLKYPRA